MSRSGGSLCGHSKGVSPVDMGMSGKVAVIRLCCMIVASAGFRPQRATIAYVLGPKRDVRTTDGHVDKSKDMYGSEQCCGVPGGICVGLVPSVGQACQ